MTADDQHETKVSQKANPHKCDGCGRRFPTTEACIQHIEQDHREFVTMRDLWRTRRDPRDHEETTLADFGGGCSV
jgi:hypothetical protein